MVLLILLGRCEKYILFECLPSCKAKESIAYPKNLLDYWNVGAETLVLYFRSSLPMV